jgi:hypothetical protein
MSYSKTAATYVLYTEKDKLSVSEENSFESYYEENQKSVQEILRQTFLIPVLNTVSDSDDTAELIPKSDIRKDFINKAIKSKATLYITRVMKEVENRVQHNDETGKDENVVNPTFIATKEPMDLTAISETAKDGTTKIVNIFNEPPKRERLTLQTKVNRLLGDASEEEKAALLQQLLAAMQEQA